MEPAALGAPAPWSANRVGNGKRPLPTLRSVARRLHRLDVHLAELHDALAVLERDMAARKLAVLRAIDRAGAVERHGEFRALGGDLVGVPFAAGLEHGRRLGHVGNPAGP